MLLLRNPFCKWPHVFVSERFYGFFLVLQQGIVKYVICKTWIRLSSSFWSWFCALCSWHFCLGWLSSIQRTILVNLVRFCMAKLTTCLKTIYYRLTQHTSLFQKSIDCNISHGISNLRISSKYSRKRSRPTTWSLEGHQTLSGFALKVDKKTF